MQSLEEISVQPWSQQHHSQPPKGESNSMKDEQINTEKYTYDDTYSVFKKKGNGHVWMSPRGITLSEISHSQKHKYT